LASGVIERPSEFRAVLDFLGSADRQPSGLVIEGEAGIGKTTLWLAGVSEAAERGFQVFSARGGMAETALAYAAVADLLGDVDPAVLAALPEVQRIAIDRVLLRAGGDGPATDEGVVAAAFAAVIDGLATHAPVLLAIDDVQWLDPSSQAVVESAARRFTGRVGLMFTERTEHGNARAARWLQPAGSDPVGRVRVGPLSLGGLHALISTRLGRSLPRPTMVQIAQTSDGNPFYALELARTIESGSTSSRPVLPATLAEAMRLRIGRLDPDTQKLLLAAACADVSTLDLLAAVTDTTAEVVVQLLDDAKAKGIIGIDDDEVRFAHPLLARSVYTDASRAQRRAMHRAYAGAVTQPELKARHMALAAASADPRTLHALDEAAGVAAGRGAPAAAAELLDLAIGLGGDNPDRRIRAADHHMRAGDLAKARTLLDGVLQRAPSGLHRSMALNLLASMQIHSNSFAQAADLLLEAFDNAEGNREIQVRTLLLLSFAQLNAGDFGQALENAERAVSFASVTDNPDLTSQVLSVREVVACMSGYGVSGLNVRRALELESNDSDAPIALRASANCALLMAYVGRLDEAAEQMDEVRRRCTERGSETDLIFVSFFSTLFRIWRGRFTEAAAVAQETVERAEQLGGDHLRVVALTVRAMVGSYLGQKNETRQNARAAIELAQQCGSPRLSDWASISLGFLEVSLENHAEALIVLEPLIALFEYVPGTEIVTTGYFSDAIESLITQGRLAQAERMIEPMEDNGRRLNRPWMLAVGARARARLLASHGDVAAAVAKAEEAMTHHEQLAMPFERARTMLLLGQLQRRQRNRGAAKATLSKVVELFETMGTPIWVQRARSELARSNVSPSQDVALTPSEQRVAELAASGMTTREVAATLFISPKTVETNLARIYRKLGIKTRAELGRAMGERT
jgi:ATP/maltotriose-dependent transcriptional regulator MalT